MNIDETRGFTMSTCLVSCGVSWGLDQRLIILCLLVIIILTLVRTYWMERRDMEEFVVTVDVEGKVSGVKATELVDTLDELGVLFGGKDGELARRILAGEIKSLRVYPRKVKR